jgi:concanavalin A-like lectin/glucanase superfamily protein/VanZ like protein
VKTFNPEKLHEWLITLLLIVIFLLIFISSLLPFQLAGSWAEIKTALLQEGKGGEMTLLDLIPDFDTVTERLLVFVPFGFFIHQKLMRHQPQHAKVISVCLVVLVALGVEISQAIISARHSRVLDFVLAAAAGIVGIKLSIPVFHIFTHSAFGTTRRLLPGFLWLGNYILVCICIAAIIPASADIGEWDCNYPLLVGNELTYDRPWQGKIRGMAIYPRELTTSEIRNLSHIPMTPENISSRNAAEAVALYSFVTSSSNQTLVHDHAGPRLDLAKKKQVLGGPQLNGDAFHFREPLLIKSTVPARAICNAIMASQAFTVETEIASNNLMQGGPARIISNSIDLENRNFTLGEEQGDLVLRIRTPLNGSDGSNIPFKTQGNALAGGWKHVIASYADGTAKFYIDGKEITMPLNYQETFFLDTALSASTALAAGLLLFGMGIMASMLFHQRAPYAAAAMSISSTSLVPIISLLTVTIWLGRQLNPILVGAVVFIPFLGFIFYRRLQRNFKSE